jgi:FkbM family methyltransferase
MKSYYPNLKLNSNSVVLDLGAHEGWFSDLCARAGAKVVAFEPNPYTFKKGLKRLHGRQHVLYINAAVSTYSGWSSMYFPRDYKFAPELHSGSGSLMQENCSLDLTNEVSCAVVSLQSILDQFDSIDFLKVDIEGAERHLWPIFALNHTKIRHLAIETHERLFVDHQQWISEALDFIAVNQLSGKWRLDWP